MTPVAMVPSAIVSVHAYTDDREVGIRFDAAEYFRTAAPSQIARLILEGYTGCGESDMVCEAYNRDGRTETTPIFEHLANANEYDEEIGYECRIEEPVNLLQFLFTERLHDCAAILSYIHQGIEGTRFDPARLRAGQEMSAIFDDLESGWPELLFAMHCLRRGAAMRHTDLCASAEAVARTLIQRGVIPTRWVTGSLPEERIAIPEDLRHAMYQLMLSLPGSDDRSAALVALGEDKVAMERLGANAPVLVQKPDDGAPARDPSSRRVSP